LRPPQGCAQGNAHGYQQEGIEIGQPLQAHGANFRREWRDRCLKLLRFCDAVMTAEGWRHKKVAICLYLGVDRFVEAPKR
jgi:hypothetical protein